MWEASSSSPCSQVSKMQDAETSHFSCGSCFGRVLCRAGVVTILETVQTPAEDSCGSRLDAPAICMFPGGLLCAHALDACYACRACLKTYQPAALDPWSQILNHIAYIHTGCDCRDLYRSFPRIAPPTSSHSHLYDSTENINIICHNGSETEITGI